MIDYRQDFFFSDITLSRQEESSDKHYWTEWIDDEIYAMGLTLRKKCAFT